MGRRFGFMRKVGAMLTLGAALSGPATNAINHLINNKIPTGIAQAEGYLSVAAQELVRNFLPPGIFMSSKGVQEAWYCYLDGDYHGVQSCLGLIPKKYQNYSFDKHNEPKNNPAVYLLLAMINMPAADFTTKPSYGNLPGYDPMVDLAHGIEYYVAKWKFEKKHF